jgi:hypothetical protein
MEREPEGEVFIGVKTTLIIKDHSIIFKSISE